MIASRADIPVTGKYSKVGLSTALVVMLAAGPALAQQGGPIRLAPLAPATERSADGTRTTDNTAQPQPGAVVVEGLEALAEDALGTLGDDSGGLGQAMWSGSRRVDVVRLLEGLPTSYPLVAARELAQRVLLTAASPPPGLRSDDGMLALRIAKLAAIGAADSAIQLGQAANARAVPDHLAAPMTQAAFGKGDINTACRIARGYGGGYAEAFWQQALIVCQVADGKADQAALGLDLLREQGVRVDPVFVDVALTLADGGVVDLAAPREDAAPDELTMALLLAAKTDIPAWFVDAVPAGLLGALLEAPQLDPDLRLITAHKALRLGVVDGSAVAAVYGTLEVSEDAMAAALSAPDTVDDDRFLAYLYLTAVRQELATARSEALWEAWARSREIGGFDIVAQTTAALLYIVPVSPDLGWLAGVAAEVSLVAGHDARALEWYRLVLRQASIVTDSARVAAVLWAPMRVIGRAKPGAFALTAGTGVTVAVTGRPVTPVSPRGPVPWNAARFERWIDLATANGIETNAGLVLYLIGALGDPVDDAQWRMVPMAAAGPAVMPSASVLAGMARAAEAGRKAETALYALYALGQSGESPHASVLGDVTRALIKVRLNDVAQALARESILRNGAIIVDAR
jgi:hypothetical protein